MLPNDLTLQTYTDGGWQDAARLTLAAPDAGWRGGSTLDYEIAYLLDVDPILTGEVRGLRALSVTLPPSLKIATLTHWPPFLLDLLPQGHARKVLADILGYSQDSPACDTALLLRAGGGPIGNIRVKEAWAAERKRLRGKTHPGLTERQVFARDDVFAEFARDFSAVAAGSSGVPGLFNALLLL